MNRRGFSLIEFSIAMILGAIMATILVAQIYVGQRLIASNNATYGIVQEADIAMSQIVRVVRFADPATVRAPGSFFICTVKGGHLPEFPADTQIRFNFVGAAHSFNMWIVKAGQWEIHNVAINITAWSCPTGSTNPSTFIITASAPNGSRSVTLQTTVSPLEGRAVL